MSSRPVFARRGRRARLAFRIRARSWFEATINSAKWWHRIPLTGAETARGRHPLDGFCESSWIGYFGDAALTVPVGKITPEREKLLQGDARVAGACGSTKVRPGNRLGDVSAAVQQWVEKNGYSVVREFVGHGIGTKMHEDPQLPNYGHAPGQGPRLPRGPGAWRIEPYGEYGRVLVGGGCSMMSWTAVTADAQRHSAHFEHTASR